MALERGAFGFGGASFPLTPDTTNSLLVDADPAIDAAGAFFEWGLNHYLGARLTAQSRLVNLDLPKAVALRVHVEPSPFIWADQMKFPFFALWRERDVWDEHTSEYDKSKGRWSAVYLLPPLTPVQAAALQPILHAVAATLRYLARQGYDPGYAPPGGKAGDAVFNATTNSGVMWARLAENSYGAYEKIDGDVAQYYRALNLTFETLERETTPLDAYEPMEGADTSVDLYDPSTDTTVSPFIQLDTTEQAPTVANVIPSIGTYLGGTSVTVKGAGFKVGTTPTVLFDASPASSVHVVDATTITCKSPAHAVFGSSLIADVTVVNADGLSGTLSAVFTFTNP